MPKKPQDREHVFVSKVKAEGCHRVAENLYLQVDAKGNKSWLFRYTMHGKARKMGLGSLSKVTLKKARETAVNCRDMVGDGVDPLTVKKDNKAKAKIAASRGISFEKCAKAYIDAHKDSWRNDKHAQQWENTLSTYAYSVIGELPVSEIDVTLVMKVLEQKNKDFPKGKTFWQARPETASRLRGRIEAVLDWASVREYRKGENPARWRGKLENLLPKRSKVQRVEHHPALPYGNINEFITALTGQEGSAARALELVIYTACRTSEVIGARWDEIDLKQKTWTIPANRIKAGKEHRVPLSQAAVDILEDLKKKKVGDLVFPGRNLKQPMSNMAMLALLKRMERSDITVHGFRSSFRDWAAEQTNFPREVAEAALAHTIGDKVEAAYRRSDLFNKRRQLMDTWARYCQTPVKRAGDNIRKLRAI